MADAELHVIEAMCKNHNTVDGNSCNKFMIDSKLNVIEATYKIDIADCCGIRYNKSIAIFYY